MLIFLSKLVLNPEATIAVRHTNANINIINSNDLIFTIHCDQTRGSSIEHVVGLFILIVYSMGSPSKPLPRFSYDGSVLVSKEQNILSFRFSGIYRPRRLSFFLFGSNLFS